MPAATNTAAATPGAVPGFGAPAPTGAAPLAPNVGPTTPAQSAVPGFGAPPPPKPAAASNPAYVPGFGTSSPPKAVVAANTASPPGAVVGSPALATSAPATAPLQTSRAPSAPVLLPPSAQKPPLLTGEPLATARLKARFNAAFFLALKFYRHDSPDSAEVAERYFADALAADATCDPCREGVEKSRAMQREQFFLLPDSVRQLRRQQETSIETGMVDFVIYEEGTDHLLTALDYGHGDWNASVRYLSDLSKLQPDDRRIRESLITIQSLQAGAKSQSVQNK